MCPAFCVFGGRVWVAGAAHACRRGGEGGAEGSEWNAESGGQGGEGLAGRPGPLPEGGAPGWGQGRIFLKRKKQEGGRPGAERQGEGR